MDQLYQQMWHEALRQYANNGLVYDEYLNGRYDSRRGITLLSRLNASVSENIAAFLQEFDSVFPSQYLYPLTDFHVTVMSIVSCKEEYSIGTSEAEDYRCAVEEIVRKFPPITLTFRGITASPSCILLRGFTPCDTLRDMREAIRTAFKTNGLAHSMDSRYAIKSAHSTVIRYKTPIENPSGLIQFLKKHEEREFGTFEVNALELVFNDWYQSQEHTKRLACIALANSK